MTPLLFVLAVGAISFAAGTLGSLLGLGGGVIVVPALTLLLGIDIRLAIGASIISVIATSSGAAAAYVRDRLANLRVAMFLELGTTSGAITGAWVAGMLHPRWLFVLFGVILAYSAVAMLRGRRVAREAHHHEQRLAKRLALAASYYDDARGAEVEYEPTRPMLGLVLMYLAGVVSGLLGIGSGVLKVPAMDLAMELPIKVSTATSNFMIGVTAAASAALFFARGQIDPFIAAPVAIGVLIGAFTGSKLLGRLSNRTLRVAFVIVLIVVSVQMLIKGLRG
ncbi:MAG TPA: sulfite exporter TauE/SafE family protein [Thermoanaerobaculia bacterium]|nr:sulfite exporter TauE/SafE family protein [Thermoanaerobaculia bacterium]